MTRQIGVALGVACLVAILGAASGTSAVTAYHHAWIFMMGCSLLAGTRAPGHRHPRQPRPADASATAEPSTTAADDAVGPGAGRGLTALRGR